MRTTAIVLAGVLVGLGCRGQVSTDPPREIFQDMSDQPKYKAQGRSSFFADGRSMRRPVEGTVPFGGANYAADAGVLAPDRSFLRDDAAFYRGVVVRDAGAAPTEEFLRRIPVPLTRELLQRGRERYGIFCAVCHGEAGFGDGITTKYGMVGVANLHLPKYREMADGEIFHVISNGRNTMLPYAAQIKPADRWAIVAWVRVLQRSQNATWDDVPPEHRGDLEKQP
jgi:mono/diheme cytochrome c family protein